MMIQTDQVVDSGHGGDIYSLQRRYGVSAAGVLDFSANINPRGMPEFIRSSILSSICRLHSYPDPEYSDLREGIARYLRSEPREVVVGNGAVELIRAYFDVRRPRRVLIPAPTFSEYERAARGFGARVSFLPLRAERGFHLDARETKEALDESRADTLVLCNPNNPTSTQEGLQELGSVLEALRQRGTALFIDETFIELSIGGVEASMVPLLHSLPEGSFVLRAISKIFAVPGLRLGYGVGGRQTARRLSEGIATWSVNSFAASLGGVFDAEKAYLAQTTAWAKEEPLRLYAALRLIPEFTVFPPAANFVLAKWRKGKAADLKRLLLSQGILIRDAANFRNLDDTYFRVAVRSASDNEALLAALREVARG